MSSALSNAGYGPFSVRTFDDISLVFADTLGGRPFPTRDAPFAESGDLRVLLDGRLDDRSTLLAKLDQPHLSPDLADVELIMAAYRRWGDKCPENLLGEYAFVVFDAQKQTIFCARDHVGARPFFYAIVDKQFAFSSDIKAILSIPGIDETLDENMIATALCDRTYDPLDRTFFRAITKLPPGHSAIVRNGKIWLRRYWKPRNQKVRLPDAQAYADRLRVLFDQAVSDRLRGGRQFGLHLSGGLDSTSIAVSAVASLRAAARSKPIGFSWHRLDPNAPQDSEPAWSEAARAATDIELIAPLPQTSLIVARLRADWTQEPNPDELLNEEPVQLAAAARGVDVMLSGWGGDQAASFEGRGLEVERFVKGRWLKLWRENNTTGISKRIRLLLWAARGCLSLRGTRVAFVGKSFAAKEFLDGGRVRRVRRVRRSSTFRAMSDLYAKGAITARLEAWAQNGAKHGIEYRYPLLDRRIMDFCYSIPGDMFRRAGQERWLMRAAMADLLPTIVAEFAGKDEPVRAESLAPPLIDAFAILADEIERSPDMFARSRYVDIPALLTRIRAPWRSLSGQAPVRLALQMLDFPAASKQPGFHRPK